MGSKFKHVDGFDELDKALAELQELTGKSGKPVLRRALVKSAKVLVDETRSNSPWPNTEDESKIKAGTSYIDGEGKRRKAKEPTDSVFCYVYDPHPLAAIFEFGTVDRYQDSTGRYTGVIEPQSYLRGSTQAVFEQVVDSQADLIGQEIVRAFDKHAKKG